MDLAGKRIGISVLFDTVRIEIACGDDYEAQVLFDDVADVLKANGSVTIKADVSSVINDERDKGGVR